MIGYRLCQTKKAKNPYYIENISTNIRTMEELCFYICHNLYLLDETILNKGLAGWLRDELDLPVLARKLERLLENHASVGELILPIIREIQYLPQSELKDFQEQLQQMSGQHVLIRKKLKGDRLLEYKKYGNALRVYKEVEEESDHSETGFQFKGSIYHNMGCAYARMFQMEEALAYFEKAYRLMHSREVLRSLLSASYLLETRERFQERVKALKTEAETATQFETEIREAMENASAIEAETVTPELLASLTAEYHRNTGY